MLKANFYLYSSIHSSITSSIDGWAAMIIFLTVFNAINKVSERYVKHYMNFTYDQQMSRLIQKYNDKIFLLTKNK